MHNGASDPRIEGWERRLAARAEQAIDCLAAVGGVTGLIVGGSVGRGEHWPLSDIDVIVVSAGRPVDDVCADIDRRAYELSELWGAAGLYTAVDAGRLVFDETEIRTVADMTAALENDRWFHGIDKVYGGWWGRDDNGAAAELLRLATEWRFAPEVVRRRITAWISRAEHALTLAEQVSCDDPTSAWAAVRRAATAIAEAATEVWGERAGSLGRYWTHFEARANRHGGDRFAEALLIAAHAQPGVPPDLPEWFIARIDMSMEARRQVGEDVTPEQNARDNVLAFAGLFRSRFPTATDAWLRPLDADITASVAALRQLREQLLQDRRRETEATPAG